LAPRNLGKSLAHVLFNQLEGRFNDTNTEFRFSPVRPRRGKAKYTEEVWRCFGL
jgi:polyisoprenoid-binding protein YceI